jgi:hypothetical protein
MVLDLFSSSKMTKELIDASSNKEVRGHRAKLCMRNLMVETMKKRERVLTRSGFLCVTAEKLQTDRGKPSLAPATPRGRSDLRSTAMPTLSENPR